MTSASPSAAPAAAFGGRPNILRRAEAWLDSKGRKAWIAAMVVSFVLFWPLGLAFVIYITATNRWSSDTMFGCAARRHRHGSHHDRYAAFRAAQPSGNSAFDSYKSEMLKRLETEQTAFEAFLQRLRAAKDKSEFDAFMEDRARENRATDAARDETAPEAPKADLPRAGEY
ncbi:DUF2852 domain-containing protein [Tabrizicola oligotrophica]|uniref:DUF2852 domain-containing protein n=1 Tax=Tabrizicola oligotrophica TaxID=2710650 RepID=A0A6M0QN35_9RHOB|nr:DUF2852 domain-containing protein [Tabrizicola oligotrophica]NEY88777.1 DUF2852 domain-containing protein [Tabrizicola oligotrophica]